MADRARLVTAVAVLIALLALARYGMIDSGAQRIALSIPGTAPTRPAAMAATPAAESEPAAIRRWLREQLDPAVELPEQRILELLHDLDEDPADRGRLRLMPTGRSVPKDSLGKPDGWAGGHLWPAGRGLGEGLIGGASDLRNLYAVEPDLEARRGGQDYADAGKGFEPAEAWKGDIARTLFYLDLRYDGEDGGPDLRLVDGPAQDGERAFGRLCNLLRWNELDPVDVAERRREDWIAKRQGDHNPFVGRPEFATILWGPQCGREAP
jgi:hypothetical protein